MEYEQLTICDTSSIKQLNKKVISGSKERSYEEFVDKFKSKKTTDDCYTPKIIYDAVADWVADEYELDKALFVRPFYPGGNYKEFDYSGGKIVVDNPPFSILSDIIQFYVARDILFFLFTPTLTGLVRYSEYCTVFPTGVDIEYENGAVVPTSFATNLDPHNIVARTVPDLFKAVDLANKANRKENKVHHPKYIYPMDVITSAQMYPFAKLGIAFVIQRNGSRRISYLDAQKREGKTIFGCGWLLAEREKAEREKATVWELSEREKQIISELNMQIREE